LQTTELDILRKNFPAENFSRGTQIKLSGAPEQVESAKEKLISLSSIWNVTGI
jgi:hypothetical protein